MRSPLHLLTSSLLCLFVATPIGVKAQGIQTGTMAGTTRDATGLMLPEVTVTVASPGLQGTRTAKTDSRGYYIITGLPAGVYTVDFSRTGFEKATASVSVPLGGEAEVHVTLQIQAVTQAAEVVTGSPSPLTSDYVGANLRSEVLDLLPVGRTLTRVALMAPGLSNTAPRSNQLSIAGAFGYDTVFMIDGVDVNDNLWGTPENLFVEDSFEESQVLTSGIGAQYGRFTGGIVNVVTKSGGDQFSGGVRINLTNPSWVARTPFERTNGVNHPNELSKYFEGTLGGPIARQRLWFFLAARDERSSKADAFSETGLPFTRTRRDSRVLLKLTGRLGQRHTLQGSYLKNDTSAFGPSTSISIDPATLVTRLDPTDLLVATYRGTFRDSWSGELQFSRKTKKTEEDRLLSTNLRDSSFFAYDFPLRQYNAPHFNLVEDPEERNNWQVTGNVSHFRTTTDTGSHFLKAGMEHFVSTRVGGNSQSQTGFAYDANFRTSADGQPVFDPTGKLIPMWIPDGALIETITATPGARLDVKTTSAYLQDEWRLNDRLSLSLGARFEHTKSEAPDNVVGVNDATLVPRLGVSYDIGGAQRQVISATYGHYVGAYNPLLVGQNTVVGNATNIFGVYQGPPGEGIDFAPGLDPSNYVTAGCFTCPPENVTFDNLSSPIIREWTGSLGSIIGRGYARVTFVNRTAHNLSDDFITLDNGSTTITRDGVIIGTFDNRVYRNSDELFRDYRALVLQGQQRLHARWTVDGHWTIQLRNHGNIAGESEGNPVEPTFFGDYPEFLTPSRHFPAGRLPGFQRHRARVWTVYGVELGRAGLLDVAGLWRYDSATTFSYRANHPLTSIQKSLGTGYAGSPVQVVFFDERGVGEFNGAGLLDLSMVYKLPIANTLNPWLKLEVFNTLNNSNLIRYDTTILRDTTGPTDALGLATDFVKSATFGQADSNDDFPAPLPGEVGGRTFQLSFGVRF